MLRVICANSRGKKERKPKKRNGDERKENEKGGLGDDGQRVFIKFEFEF